MTLLTAIGAHLGESTVCAGVIGLVTLAFRKNHAAIRHALWLAASVKFLVPFAALTALGAELGRWLPRPVRITEVVLVTDSVREPLAPLLPLSAAQIAPRDLTLPWLPIVAVVWLCGTAAVVVAWCVSWRRLSAIAREATRVHSGRTLDALRRVEADAGIARPIALVESTASLEPGVFGLITPVLVWPCAIGALNEPQQIAILAHEVAHVRRRDNLTSAIHMVVEAVFWFQPLVWWLGARLVDERERACDEAVVRLGSEPEMYAETILKACRIFLGSPLACVSGVTGSNLRKRVERIVRNGPSMALTPTKKPALPAAAAGPIPGPNAGGIVGGPRLRAASMLGTRLQITGTTGATRPEFEVASVKQNKSGMGKVSIQTLPGGRFTAENITLRGLIRFAYRLDDARLTGGPSWLDADRFDIVAKAENGDLGEPYLAEQRGEASRGQMMLQSLLADRFKLRVHTEDREQALYALVRARRDGTFGPELRRSTLDCHMAAPRADAPSPGGTSCGIRIGGAPGTIVAGGASIGQLARTLTTWVGRVVVDRTEMTGDFDFTLRWTPDQMAEGFGKKVAAGGLAPADPNGPSIFTAIQEQLGLKLDAQKGTVDVLIVDSAEHPIEN